MAVGQENPACRDADCEDGDRGQASFPEVENGHADVPLDEGLERLFKLLIDSAPAILAGVGEVTRILAQLHEVAPKAAEDLLPLVYDELRKLAMSRMAHEKPGQTLQATALVHEAWLRVSAENQRWQNRAQFFSAAAEAMRRILIERARHRQRVRHGGRLQRVSLDDLDLAENTGDELLLIVNDSLDALAKQDGVGAELVKLRFFAGLSNVEAAEILGLSERTAKRNWAYARAWLYEEIQRQL